MRFPTAGVFTPGSGVQNQLTNNNLNSSAMAAPKAYSATILLCNQIKAGVVGSLASGITLVILLCMTPVSSAQMFMPDRTDTSKRCAICHFEWVYTFFTERRDGELIPQPKDKLVATAGMCFSCHDGSITDSRKTVLHDQGHRAGIVPSSRVSIPGDLPLDEEGRMQCATCHTPHAVQSSDGSSVEFFLRTPNKNSSFCVQCHRSAGGGPETGNHPTAVALKSIPPSLMNAGGMFGTGQPNQIICETCHVPHGEKNSVSLLLPIEDPSTRSALCEVCHTKNPGRSPEPALNRFSHPLGTPSGINAQLPIAWPNGEKVFFGKQGELVCRTCHQPHGAPSRDHLLVEQGEKDSLCRLCHPGQSALIGSSHDLRKSAPQERTILKKTAQELGPCGSCHSAHSGSAPFMWAQSMPDTKIQPARFCSSCHAEGRCAASAVPKKFSHPLEVAVAGTITALQLPLFDSDGRKKRSGTISCSTCHDVHDPRPLFAGTPEGEGQREGFLRSIPGEGAAGLCIHCHTQQSAVQGSKHDLTMANGALTGLSDLTPAGGGACSFCHAPHGAVTRRYLWTGLSAPPHLKQSEAEASSDANVIVTICSGCHAEGGIASNRAPVVALHPPGLVMPYGMQSAAEDGFPLYNPEGEIIPDGDIVCATCHNPHQWDAGTQGAASEIGNRGTAATSFLREGVHQSLCASCHGEEGLFKFLFFHRSTRTGQDAPFTQLQRKR